MKTRGYLLFACRDNLNNLWLLLHRFQKLAFSVKTIRLHDNDIIISISFSNLFTLETIFKSYRFQLKRSSFLIVFMKMQTVKTQRKVCCFDENDMKTYSCRRGFNQPLPKTERTEFNAFDQVNSYEFPRYCKEFATLQIIKHKSYCPKVKVSPLPDQRKILPPPETTMQINFKEIKKQ